MVWGFNSSSNTSSGTGSGSGSSSFNANRSSSIIIMFFGDVVSRCFVSDPRTIFARNLSYAEEDNNNNYYRLYFKKCISLLLMISVPSRNIIDSSIHAIITSTIAMIR